MKILPDTPNLQFLLREAKALKSSHRSGDYSVCTAIGHFDYSLHGLSNQEVLDTRISILDAQRVVARQYGFSSWSRLKKYVERCQIGKNLQTLNYGTKYSPDTKKLYLYKKSLALCMKSEQRRRAMRGYKKNTKLNINNIDNSPKTLRFS